MSSNVRPQFYRPVFGNDNFYAPDVIDMASFSPAMQVADAAATAAPQSQKIAEKA